MKILAIIPARSGSKGFPNKNIKKVGKTTLLELAVKVGINCKIIDDVYISTDSKEYENIALQAGAKTLGLRPTELATDGARTIDVVIDLINKLNQKYDYVILLQPTSPIRKSQDIVNMINLIEKNGANASVSVTKFEEPHPCKLKKINNSGYLQSFIDGTTSEISRQSLPEVYALNGAIYIAKVENILHDKTFFPEKTLPYIMDVNINIDSEEDFIFLKAMVKNKKIKLQDM